MLQRLARLPLPLLPLLALLNGCGCATLPLLAQATHVELFGLVRDPAGMAVPSAGVLLVHAATGRQSAVATDPNGTFHFFALPAGNYRVTVARTGFAPRVQDGILLRVGDRVRLDLDLTLGDESQTVEVTAAPPLLQATRGSVGFVTAQRKVVALPLDGRNFVPLIALAPGVSLPPGSTLPRINGSRPRVNEYLYDGISVLQPEPGQVALFPIVDAIEEFRVETNSYSAEYGRANGGVIMVSQKSGSNSLHGTLFEFFRNEKLNARNLFAGSAVATPAKPRFRRNQYGFVVGGPVERNRTFFFVDWQGTRLSNGVVQTSTVPLTAQRQGLFAAPVFDPATTTRRADGTYERSVFPGGVIPPGRWDRASLAVAGRYPNPNVYTASGAEAAVNNYRRIGTSDTGADQFDTRLDRYFGAGHRVFGRYSYLRDDSRPTTPLPDGSGNLTAGIIGETLTRADSVAAEHTWNLTPAAVNQMRFGFTRRMLQRKSLATGQPVGQATRIPNIPTSSFSDVLPTYDIVGLQQLGPPASGNARFTTSVTQFINNYSWGQGGHSLKAGADIRLQRLNALQPPSPTGNIQFTSVFTSGLTPQGTTIAGTGNSYASFLLGQVNRFSIDAQPESIEPRASVAEFFLQDDWRVRRKLTLNLGVRYTLNVPSTVAGDRGAVFNLDSERLQLLGVDGYPRTARELEIANFGPRLGLAWQMSDAMVLRAGYGLTWIEQAGITTPFTTPLFPFIQTLTQQSLDNIYPAFVLAEGPSLRVQPAGPDSGLGQGVFAVQRDNGSGYAQQWNLSLQKTIAEHWSIEAGYLGSKLTRLGVPDVNLNQLPVEQLAALGSQLTRQVPNPFFGQIPANSSLNTPTIAQGQLLRPYPRFTTVALYRNNVGHSTYHSAQARLERRLARGLSFTAAYTFSKLIDDAGAVFDAAVLTGPVTNFQAADSFNKQLEKDVSTGHIPHVMSAGFVYDLPLGRGRLLGGWQVAGIARVQSGSPIAVTQATNLNAFAGFGIQRPNRIASPHLEAAERSTGRWFDTAAFTQAPQFTIGNSSRNPVTGPGYRTLDVMIGKTFLLTERLRAELRMEAFNATNTPPLGNPNGSFGNPAFGTITTAMDPRVFEIVCKLQF